MDTENMKKQIQDAFDRESGIKRYILVCSCHNQEKKALDAFKIAFLGMPIPEVVKGRDRLYKLGKELGNGHIIAISKLSGRYAYYVELDDEGMIKLEYNLTTMRRTA